MSGKTALVLLSKIVRSIEKVNDISTELSVEGLAMGHVTLSDEEMEAEDLSAQNVY